MSFPSTIAGLNKLPEDQKKQAYGRIVPPELLELFDIRPDMLDENGEELLVLNCPPDSSDAELALFDSKGARDPVLFGHITDTIHGQIHILLYGMNDVRTQRFDVDRLPDGTKTSFGTNQRNIEAELAAMKAGLAPGQIYRGPHLFRESLRQFERFVSCMGQELFFVEPLYYHVAIIFEKFNFHYQTGKRFMKRIDEGFSPGGDLLPLLNEDQPFRPPRAANQIRLRSWAVHDNILSKPFTGVTMYKYVEKEADPCQEERLTW